MVQDFDALLKAQTGESYQDFGSSGDLPGVLADGVFWYWQTPVDAEHVRRRQALKTARKALRLLATLVGVLGVVGFGVLAVLEYQELVLELDFWANPNVLVGELCVTGLVWLFVIYLNISQRPKLRSVKQLGKQTNLEVTSVPSAAAVQKTDDIARLADDTAWASVEEAYRLARTSGSAEVEPVHFFIATLSTTPLRILLARLGLSFDDLKDPLRRHLSTLTTGDAVFGTAAQGLLAEALHQAFITRRTQLSALDLFSVAVAKDDFLVAVFADHGITTDELDNAVAWLRIAQDLRERYLAFRQAAIYKPTNNMDRAMTAVATPFLETVSEDLTRAAVFGQTSFLVGRERELQNIFRAIEGGNQSVILVGEPGVGKGAIVHGIADLMVEERVPKVLQDKRLLKLSIPHLVSANANDPAEERMLYALNQVAHAGNVVLVIENIHELVGNGQGVDLASILAQELRKGYTFVIATTTPQAYAEAVEQSVLGPKLQKIVIDEPERNEIIRILEAKVGGVEAKHQVIFTYSALAALADLTTRYVHEGSNPEKAVEIMKEVALAVSQSAKESKGPAWVKKEDVANLVSERTGIPTTDVTQAEGQELLRLEERIHQRVVGQDRAVKAIASALRRARTELRSGQRPIANFLFLGPTGVGKTELAKATAEVYFGNEDSMLRFDMSEYQDQTSVTRLIGDTGKAGLLTEAVRRNPFSLLLLDELEKANPDILNLFLQVMDDGRLTDGLGRTVDFTNVILIATSNAGTSFIQDQVQAGQSLDNIKEVLVANELRQSYHPEFLNRFDEIIVFAPLTKDDMATIAYLLVSKVVERLKAKGIILQVTDAAVHELAEVGYDPKFGARPLRRAIQDHLENPLAEYLLKGEVGRRDTLIVDAGGQITLQKADQL